MSRNKAPAFQFYPADFVLGTAEMSNEEVGAYIRLLCHQWSNGSLPNSKPSLSRLIGGENVSDAVLAKFDKASDGRLLNVRLEAERKKQAEYREKQAINGSKGGRPKTQLKPKPNPSLSSGFSQNKAREKPTAKPNKTSSASAEDNSDDASRQSQDGPPSASDGIIFCEEKKDLSLKEKKQSGAEHRSAQVFEWGLCDAEIAAGEAATAAKTTAIAVRSDPMRATPEFDPWIVEFRRVWNATPGTVKLTGRISHSVQQAIWARRADEWFQDNWRLALSKFPLPYFHKRGQLIGVAKFFTEPNFIEYAVEGKWQIDFGETQPKPDYKTSQAHSMMSELEDMLSNGIQQPTQQKVISHG